MSPAETLDVPFDTVCEVLRKAGGGEHATA